MTVPTLPVTVPSRLTATGNYDRTDEEDGALACDCTHEVNGYR